MDEITKENCKQLQKNLKQFYLNEIEEFVFCNGGQKFALPLLKISKHVYHDLQTKGIEKIEMIYDQCQEIGYSRDNIIDVDEICSELNWTREMVYLKAKIGVLNQVYPGKPLFERESAMKYIKEIKERQRIAGKI